MLNLRQMGRAVARDVIRMVSAVIVITVIASVGWLSLVLWLLPRSHETLKWLSLVVLALVVLALGSIGAVLYALLRIRIRPGQLIGPPYWQDALVIPLLAALVLGSIYCLTALVTGDRASASEAFLLGLAQTVPLALAACLVSFVQRSSSRPTRALIMSASALVAVWLGARVFLDAWGDRIFAEYKSVATAEIATERQRIAADRLPVIFGTPIDDNAADRYRSVAHTLGEAFKDFSTTSDALKAGPDKPLSQPALRWLEVHEPQLQVLREAVRCTRCDWRFAWEQGFESPMPDLMAARMGAQLLALDGYKRARTGDVLSAAERDLETIRMGRDYETSYGLVGVLGAFGIEHEGIRGLLQLVASGNLPAAPDWDALEAKLDVLEPRLASAAVGYRGERLVYVGWATRPPNSASFSGLNPTTSSVFDFIAPGRLMLADFARSLNHALREMEKASELPDPREANRLTQAAEDQLQKSANVMVHIAIGGLARLRSSQDDVLARFRLLRGAVRLERIWQRTGRYPSDAGEVDLPVDPFAYPAQLHYTSLAEGRGYRVWTVGRDGRDDGGAAKERADDVFEKQRHSPDKARTSNRAMKP
jgi:hypothetical protein